MANSAQKIFKLKKVSLPIGFTTAEELTAGQGLDKFVTSDVILPYLANRFTNFYNQIAGDAPLQALDTLREIGDRLTSMGDTEGSIQQMISEIIGTKASISYVDGKLQLKADLSMVQGSVADINGRIQSEITARTTEIARIEALTSSENSARHTDVSNILLDILNERTARQSDVTNLGIDIATKASKIELQTEITARTVEVTRIEGIANSKTTNEHLEVRIAEVLNYESNRDVNTRADLVAVATNKANDALTNAKADSRGYTDNHILNLNANILPLLESKAEATASIAILNTAIATKQTLDDVNNSIAYWREHFLTPQYKGMVDALRAEMLAIEGIDQTEFTRLKDLLAQLTSLESSDVAGLNTSIALKIAKTDLLGIDWSRVAVSPWETLLDIADSSLDGKILDARLIHNLLINWRYHIDLKVNTADILTEGQLANFDTTVQSDDKVMSAAAVKNRIYGVYLEMNKKANIADAFAKDHVLDSAWLGATLHDYINFITTATEAQIGTGKVVDAILLQRILGGLKYFEIDTKFAKDHVLDLAWINANLSDWVEFRNLSNEQIGEGKVVDAKVLRHLVNDLYMATQTKFAKSNILDEVWLKAHYNITDVLQFVNTTDADRNDGEVIGAKAMRNILHSLLVHSDQKVAGTKVAKSSWLYPNESRSIESFLDESSLNSDHVFSAELTQGLIKILNVKVDTKVSQSNFNSLVSNVWAKDSTFNRDQIMSGLNERATNARVQTLEDLVATLVTRINDLEATMNAQ